MPRRVVMLWLMAALTAFTVYLHSLSTNRQLDTGREQLNASARHHIKTILYWNSFFEYQDYGFGFGRKPFVDNRCPVDNCYVTNRRDEGPQVEDFDAVIFHAWQLGWVTKRALSKWRRSYQRYVFFLMEAPGVHQSRLDQLPDFFNWTMTYRVDSDIYRPYVYFAQLNDSRRYVDIDERRHPTWAVYGNWTPGPLPAGKTRLVAWFVSKCHTQSQRELYVKELQKHVSVDVYGSCGSLDCPKEKMSDCRQMLEEQYKFYLSFENSLCEDYVTEKLLTAMQHHVVPIVYGGADYGRIAPPGSYIDTADFAGPKELAAYLRFLDANPAEYAKYFRWKQTYTIRYDTMPLAMCKLCAMLNDPLQPPSTYKDIHKWYDGPGVCHEPSEHWDMHRRRNRSLTGLSSYSTPVQI